jgi:hypothetical protein
LWKRRFRSQALKGTCRRIACLFQVDASELAGADPSVSEAIDGESLV